MRRATAHALSTTHLKAHAEISTHSSPTSQCEHTEQPQRAERNLAAATADIELVLVRDDTCVASSINTSILAARVLSARIFASGVSHARVGSTGVITRAGVGPSVFHGEPAVITAIEPRVDACINTCV